MALILPNQCAKHPSNCIKSESEPRLDADGGPFQTPIDTGAGAAAITAAPACWSARATVQEPTSDV